MVNSHVRLEATHTSLKWQAGVCGVCVVGGWWAGWLEACAPSDLALPQWGARILEDNRRGRLWLCITTDFVSALWDNKGTGGGSLEIALSCVSRICSVQQVSLLHWCLGAVIPKRRGTWRSGWGADEVLCFWRDCYFIPIWSSIDAHSQWISSMKSKCCICRAELHVMAHWFSHHLRFHSVVVIPLPSHNSYCTMSSQMILIILLFLIIQYIQKCMLFKKCTAIPMSARPTWRIVSWKVVLTLVRFSLNVVVSLLHSLSFHTKIMKICSEMSELIR